MTYYWQSKKFISKETFEEIGDGRIKCIIHPPENPITDSMKIEQLIEYLYPIDRSEKTIADLYDSKTGKFDMSRESEIREGYQLREIEFKKKHAQH